MKNMLEKVKNSKGFVSLEVIAIAVIIIALAAFVMFKFRGTAQDSSTEVDKTIKSTVSGIQTDANNTGAGQDQGGSGFGS